MGMAFAEAEKVKGKTLPNPPVGAVLVKNGRVIGKGGTRPAGQEHAEIVALERAGSAAKGATLYVTLEPCCHFGKTPPCTLALIAAGVKRVVAACADPNSKVSGKGFSQLRKSGVDVRTGLLEDRGEEFYEGFFFYIRHGRPKIVLKIAQSPDGRLNARPGVETAITNAKSRAFGHALRARADAILIGGETLRRDDPELTPRLVKGPVPEALVLTRKRNWDAGYRLFKRNRPSRSVMLSPREIRGLPAWVDQVRLPLSQGKKTADAKKALAKALLKVFREKGYHMVLVEGGRSVWAPFLNAGLCDVLYLFTGPKPLPKGDRWNAGLVPGWVKSLEFHRFTAFGSDILAEFRRA